MPPSVAAARFMTKPFTDTIRKRFEASAELFRSGGWAFSLAWRSHKFSLVGRIVCAMLTGLVPAAFAMVIRGVVNAVVLASKQPEHDISTAVPWLIAGLAVTAGDVVSRMFDRYAAARFEDDIDLELTSRIMEHADRLDLGYFEGGGFQDTLERARQNTTYHLVGLLMSALSFITHCIQILSLTGILFVLEPLALLVLLPFALAHFVFQWSISKRFYEDERMRATKRRWTRYFTHLVLTRELVPEVRLLDLGPLVVDRYRRLMSDFRDRNHARHLRSFIGGSAFAVLTTVAVYYMFGRVVSRVLIGDLSVGDIAVFAMAALRLRNALESVVLASTRGMTQALYISNVREFLDVKPIIDRVRGLATGITRGAIEVDNVTFTYPEASQPTLHGVSLRIEPGEIVALVGRNGAGKTTLVSLLARFYDPTSGRILIDGNDLRELSQRYLHERIGFVFQHPGRYETTARENIAYGKWRTLLANGTGEIRNIAERAGVAPLIDRLPQGYDTQLGREFGSIDLSGGQWQQLAIARALARDAALLILDEPAASLDAEAEYQLFCSSRKLAEGRTTILISHRFSTVSMADRIIVMDRGRVVETGTHAQLLAMNGYYATLYSFQQRQMEMGIPEAD